MTDDYLRGLERGLSDGLARSHYRMRNSAARVTLTAAGDDTGPTQTHQTTGFPTEVRDSVQRVQSFGLSTMPLVGAKGHVVYQGGHRGMGEILAVDDTRYRPRGLKPGESLLYGVDGARSDGTGGSMWQAFKAALGKIATVFGTTINVGDNKAVTINVGTTAKSVTVNLGSSSATVNFLAGSGDIKVNGVSLVNHTHGGVMSGGDHTAKPDQS